MKITDVNAGFGVWPVQPFAHTTLDKLDAAFERNGVTEAWVSAVESILCADPDIHDLPLFARLCQYPRLRAVKTVNPLLANWRASCEAAHNEFGLAALKLYPNYHGYPLNHRELLRLCEFAAGEALPVLVAVRINDERNQPVCMQVPHVSPEMLAGLALAAPRTTFVALCAFLPELAAMKTAANLYADISFLDFEDALLTATEEFPAERLLYGSHAPFLYPESATLKVAVTGLTGPETEGVAWRNTARMTAGKPACESHGYGVNGHATLAGAGNAA